MRVAVAGLGLLALFEVVRVLLVEVDRLKAAAGSSGQVDLAGPA
jgi:hypothetical protein